MTVEPYKGTVHFMMLYDSKLLIKTRRRLSSYYQQLLGEIEEFWPDIWRAYLLLMLWSSAFFTLIALSTRDRHQISQGQVYESSQHLQLKIHKRWNLTFNNSLIALCQHHYSYLSIIQRWADSEAISFQKVNEWLRLTTFLWHGCAVLFFSSPNAVLIPASSFRLQLTQMLLVCSLYAVFRCIRLVVFWCKIFWIRLNLVIFWLLIKISAFVPWRYFLACKDTIP